MKKQRISKYCDDATELFKKLPLETQKEIIDLIKSLLSEQ
jgi:hypothetical protein